MAVVGHRARPKSRPTTAARPFFVFLSSSSTMAGPKPATVAPTCCCRRRPRQPSSSSSSSLASSQISSSNNNGSVQKKNYQQRRKTVLGSLSTLTPKSSSLSMASRRSTATNTSTTKIFHMPPSSSFSSSSSSSPLSSPLAYIVIIVSILLHLATNGAVYSWNWGDHHHQHISEELLDRYICLRAKGFFPHELRCDHFYECRNGTIVNEGICRPGLRFDYRYRKKPRCIPIDQIDCRITQIDYSEVLDTPEPTFIPSITTTTTREVTTTTMATVPSNGTTPSPPLLAIHRQMHQNHLNGIPLSKPVAAKPPPASPPPSRNSQNIFVPHRTVGSLSNNFPAPSTTPRLQFSAFTNAFTATTPAPLPINTGNSQPSPFPAVTETPIITTTAASDRRRINSNNDNSDSNNDNFLEKKRKLMKKPLKLRRGRLQQDEMVVEDFVGSSPAHHHHHQHLEHHHHRSPTPLAHHQPPPLSEQVLSRAIAMNFGDNRAGGNNVATNVDNGATSTTGSGDPATGAAVPGTTGTTTKSIHCPHPNGYYADRDDCRKFYACDDGRAFLMSCPLGLAYDEMTGTCSWPDMVEGCRSEEMLRFNCPEPNENEILDYGDPRYPTSDCRKFVVCIQSEIHGMRTPRLLGCEEGLVFNPITRECDYPENVPSCSTYYEGHAFTRSISRSIPSRKRKNRF